MSGWKDVEKNLPPFGVHVIIYRKGFPLHMGYLVEIDADFYFVIANTFITFPATHWMELPEEPL